jgi:hypothetical protein
MSALGLGLGLSLGGRRVGDAGNMPAKFTIAAGSVDDGIKRINFSEPVTVTITGGVTLSIGGTQYQSGDTIPVAGSYHTLTINNPGEDAGTITFGKRKQITYLSLAYLNSLVVKGDITGMKLTSLLLNNLGSSVITGDITGMKLTYLDFYSLGSSVITGDITGMKLTLTYLLLDSLGSSVITGYITGMKLTYLRLSNIGSSIIITGDINGMALTRLYLHNVGLSLTYGTNPLNITNPGGIQLLGNTVFATDAEYEQLFIDAAASTWSHSTTRPLTITGSGKNFHRDYYDWGTFSATPGASSPTPSAIAIKSLVKRGTNPVVVTLEGISAYSYAGGFPENFENWWAE